MREYLIIITSLSFILMMCIFESGFIALPPLVIFLLIILCNQFIKQQELNDLKVKTEEMDHALVDLKRLLRKVKDNLKEFETEISNIKREVTLQRKDKTGLVDYAFGGKVISIRNTETLSNEGLAVLGFKICGIPHLERRILESSVMPGNCWPFKGREGSAIIELIQPIVVNYVTLEHAPIDLLPRGAESAAPKEFSLWGLQDDGESPHLFGKFSYCQTGPEVQTFHVTHQSEKQFKVVEFNVHSNHGHAEYTCVYRVRVHGHP